MKKNVIGQNLVVGVSFIITLVLLYFGINFLKGDNVFKRKNLYSVIFEDVTDLHKSSPVFINGYQIGIVDDVRIYRNDPISFLVKINLRKGYKVPIGSEVEFKSDFLGSSAVNLIPGNSRGGYLEVGDTLKGERKKDILANVESLLPHADAALKNMDSILVVVHGLLTQPELGQLAGGIGEVVSELASSGRGVNLLIEELSSDVPGILNSVDVLIEGLNKVVGDLAEIEINETFESFNSLLEDLQFLSASIAKDDNSIGMLLQTSELHDSLSQVLFNASQLLEEIKSNPKKYLTVKVRLF